MVQPDINTTPKNVRRARAEGIPVTEYYVRMLIRQGKIPVRYVGPKALFSYSALIRYLACEEGQDNAPATTVISSGIRRIDVG